MQITPSNLGKILNEFDPSYKRMKMSADVSYLLITQQSSCCWMPGGGLVYINTAEPPHRALSEATGNCSCDLLFFKAPASPSCLLVQSLITHLYVLSPCTAGKTKQCQDCTEISQAMGVHKACLMEPPPLTWQAHIPQLFLGYLPTPPTQTPCSSS